MNEQITIIGNVGAEPVIDKGDDGRTFTRLRVGCTRRYRDPQTGAWRDTESSWYDVTANGMLADNIIKSVSKGTRVVVVGTLAVRKWSRDERSGINVTVRAESVGIDLQWAKVQQIVKTSTSHRRDEDEATVVQDSWMEPPAPAGDEDPPVGADVDLETGEVRELESATNPF